ncbi:hypothetical protein [Streptomyces sp. NBC_01237]|uniref:hypothetical protein n=1 Tax=Streptomyces sp. NBC_01237 TaxID=2903790 RepID=UPI002DDA0286|nr:hypothetical protein [Streptomyces sp. NBC_01237]WRZ76398.1 hypothetical protein OG251_34900 [Streptomyces sp. NBC_01237]
MRWERPLGGREPAAAALLGWLADPHAPGLCLVSGSQGCGKSALLAWLVRHGSRSGTPAERAVHAVVPDAGQSVRGTVWALADQLGVIARSPDELVHALGHDPRRTVIVLPDLHGGTLVDLVLDLMRLPHLRLVVESRSGGTAHRLLAEVECAEMDLDLEQWRDRGRFAQGRAFPPADQGSGGVAGSCAVVDLSDPAAVCCADPWEVTALYEAADGQSHGGLRQAWLRAGQSLCQEQAPASRALILLTALGDRADPDVISVLSELASDASWSMEWSRVRGDLAPPWPGPVSALAVGKGPLGGRLLVTAGQGTVRAVDMDDARSRGRLAVHGVQPVSVSVLGDGTVLLLDDSGHVHADSTWASRAAGSGIEGLLNDQPTRLELLMAALQSHIGTAVASATDDSVTGVVALGDASGTVRSFGDVTDSAELHSGPVSALSVLSVPLVGESRATFVYSGGADGRVRAWSPGHTPMSAPLLERSCRVTALDAAMTAAGPALAVAWGDGAVDRILWDTGEQRTFRPGPPVRAVALGADGRVVIGMDEALTCLAPAPSHPASEGSGQMFI